MTLRDLAERSGYSISTLSMAEGGRRRPSWEVTETFAQACGETDLGRWRTWWDAAVEYHDEPAERADVAGPAEDQVVGATRRLRFRRTVPLWGAAVACVVSSLLTAGVFLTVVRPGSSGAPSAAKDGALPSSPGTPLFPTGEDPTPTKSCDGAAPGYGCERKDPEATGCLEDGRTSASATFSYRGTAVGKLENWYSKSCGTNWAQLRMPDGWEARIQIVSKTTRLCFPTDCSTYWKGAVPMWTNMVFGMNRFTAAIAWVKYPDGTIKQFEADS